MPEITLTDHPHDIGWIRSVMLFPNDENLRNQNYAVEVADYEEGNIERVTEKWIHSRTNELDIPISNECIKLLIEAPSESALKTIRTERTKKGIIAGQILASIYLMDRLELEEPSLNKAIFVAKEYAKKAKYGDDSRMPAESKIKQYWKEYMPVAHFWAALELNRTYPFVADQSDCFSEKGFTQFLQAAAGIYDFGIKFIPKRAKLKETILDAEKCWKLDNSITLLHLKSDIKPEKFLKTLKKYKAPKTVI